MAWLRWGLAIVGSTALCVWLFSRVMNVGIGALDRAVALHQAGQQRAATGAMAAPAESAALFQPIVLPAPVPVVAAPRLPPPWSGPRFTVGSTADEVRAAQPDLNGRAPWGPDEERWYVDRSWILLRGGKVVRWQDPDGRLHILFQPTPQVDTPVEPQDAVPDECP